MINPIRTSFVGHRSYVPPPPVYEPVVEREVVEEVVPTTTLRTSIVPRVQYYGAPLTNVHTTALNTQAILERNSNLRKSLGLAPAY